MEDSSVDLQSLFYPASVAVIGASTDWNKWGHSTFSSLVSRYRGRVYAVNRHGGEVSGYPAYRSIGEVPEAVDLAVFVIPAAGVPGVMAECAVCGVKSAVIISAGFRETGPAGLALEEEMLAAARGGGIRVVGPNCMGLWSAPSGLSAYMFPLPGADGPVAFVTQGGNVGGALMAQAYDRGLGMRYYVSCGPAADIRVEDYLAWFAADDKVRVIMAYIEGIEDGTRFVQTLERVSARKPVIILKPGSSEAVARAILSHSGTLAGRDEIFDAAVRRAGAIRVQSPEELLDTATAFLTQPLPRGRRVGIVTGGGSYGVICAEDCAHQDLEVVDLPGHAIEKLDAIFPPRWSRGNPVDPAGDRNFLAYYLAPRLILELEEVDALLFMGFGSLAGFSTLFSGDGGDIFINRMPQMLAGLDGLDDLLGEAVALLDQGGTDAFREFMHPFLPVVAGLFGSDAPTIEAFTELLLEGPELRESLAEMLGAVPEVVGEDGAVERIFAEFEELVNKLLAHFMRAFAKPVISTTFREQSGRIEQGTYSFPSSARATAVLGHLARYREWLAAGGRFRDPLQCAALLLAEEVPNSDIQCCKEKDVVAKQ